MSEKAYQVSIVTPFHNVDMSMFSRCVKAMKAQTYGYENIEWVIVLHNCEEQYLRDVHALLDGDKNVVLRELNNDVHSPSSPRNYGMTLATGKYLGFLDADDCFTEECIATVSEAAGRNDADITVFRREYELERKGMLVITELVLWNQTEREILQTKGSLDNRLFVSNWGLVTSKLYRREFLQQSGIKFNETVTMCEDFLYNVHLYGKAERILVLPQFIGYHYFVNSGSLVQGSWSDGKRLINYCRGYAQIFEEGIRNGFDMRCTIAELGFPIALSLMNNPQISVEDRRTIRDLIGAYVEMSKPITPNKVYPPKKAHDMYELPRRIILHPEDWQSDGSRSIYTSKDMSGRNAVLSYILEKNAETDIGRRYDFMNIWTVKGYQSKVPLTDWETYRPWIRLTTQTGESNIFASEPIRSYYLDIGTDGTRRLFPCTHTFLQQQVQMLDDLLTGHCTFLNLESAFSDVSFNDQASRNSLSELMLAEYYTKAYSQRRARGTRLTSPHALLFPTEVIDTTYARMLFALKERDVDLIASFSSRELLAQFEYLESTWESICDDMEHGLISEKSGLPENMRVELSAELKPDPARAGELRAIFSEGFEHPVAQLIWPRLKHVVCPGTGDYTLYSDHLTDYIGDISRSNGAYILPEGILGYATRSFNEYKLIHTGCFVEFLLSSDNKIYTADEAPANHVYEPVLTTCSGLFRYRTGALVYITRHEDGEVYFRPMTRLNLGIKLAEGKMLQGVHLYEPIKLLETESRIRLTDCVYWGAEDGITIMPQVSAHKGEAEKAMKTDLTALSAWMHDELEKQLKIPLPPVTLRFLRPWATLSWAVKQSQETGVAMDSIFPIHYLDSKELQDFFSGNELTALGGK